MDLTKGKWVDELLEVLWAYRTTAHRSTNISPFTITYGMEAIIPIKIGMPTIRSDVPEQENAELVIKDLDMVDELRESAAVLIASYKRRLGNSYNKRVKPWMFQPGDLVLRKVFANTADPAAGNFQPNWEGPYLVTQAVESRSYTLDKLDETPVPRMWNAMHLKRYYQ